MSGSDTGGSEHSVPSSRNRVVLDALHEYRATRTKTIPATKQAPKQSSPPAEYATAAELMSDFSYNQNELLHSTRNDFQEDLLPHRQYYRSGFSQQEEGNTFDESIEVEIGRAASRRGNYTPSRPVGKFNTSDLMMVSSLPGTPVGAPRQKPIAVERGSLRRDVLQKRVSAHDTSEHLKENAPMSTRYSSKSANHNHKATYRTANSTRDSFAIPDLTNASDLFAGSSLNATARVPTRQTSRNHRSQPQFHAVAGVPLPDEEKQLIYQIEKLRHKMSQLERENSEQQEKIHDYDEEVTRLRAELEFAQNSRRPDSALGSSDGDNSVIARTKFQVENARLEATVQRLQKEVQAKDREISILQRTIDRMKDDRSQTGMGGVDSTRKLRALESENAHLRESVDDLNRMVEELNAQLDDTRDHHDADTQNWTQKEMNFTQRAAQAETAIAENQDLKDQLAAAKSEYDRELKRIRREADSRRAAEEAAKAQHATLKSENEKLQAELREARVSRNKDPRLLKKAAPGDITGQENINVELRIYNEELKTEIRRLKAEVSHEGQRRADTVLNSRSKQTRSSSKSRATRRTSVISEDAPDHESTTDISDALLAQTTAQNAQRHMHAEADTILSGIDLDEQRRIRRAAEQERLNRKHRRAVSAAELPSLARKSSLKSLNGRSKAEMGDIADNISVRSIRSRNNDTTDNEFMTGANATSHSRRSSVANTRRKMSTAQDMTSGLLLPDFTLPAAKLLHPKNNKGENAECNANTPHDPKRCTVCYRLLHPSSSMPEVKIPSTIPISSLTQDDIDATLRPSEPPRQALNRLIKQVADEIVHLKMELHATERKLNALNASRGGRERQALHEQLDLVNKALAAKNAQFYSLYDVLEGLKAVQNGQSVAETVDDDEDSEDELVDATDEVKEIVSQLKASRRVTIQSPPEKGRSATVQEWESEDSELSDDDLPWEGFTDTTHSLPVRMR